MRNISMILALVILCMLAISPLIAFAVITVYIPRATVDPVIDGSISSFSGEYSSALVISPATTGIRGETVYLQYKENWRARSVQTGNQTVYDHWTLFGATVTNETTREINDYYYFWYTDPRGAFGIPVGTFTEVWGFAEGDDPDDSDWIGASGLGYSSIDDRGFLIRLGSNPATDRQWLPGQPEPGDPAWNWAAFYGFFGSSYTRNGWSGNEEYEGAWWPTPVPCTSFYVRAGNLRHPNNTWSPQAWPEDYGPLHLLAVPVGGIVILVDKLSLLAPYIALASTILVATAATAIYVKRRNKKQ